MLNVFEIARPEDRPDIADYTAYAVDPAVMYPAALADMLEALPNASALSTALGQEITAVRDILTQEQIDRALTPKDETAEWSEEAKSNRARLLNHSRRWFTEKLHAAINHKPLNLHILKDERYRL